MWTFRGIKGVGASPPSYLDSCKGNLIILGGSRCVWDDWLRLRDAGFSGSLMAVNDIGQWIDGLNHWVSLHPANLRHWIELKRLHAMHSHNCLTHTQEPYEGIRVAWQIQPYGEQSGLFAIQVGLLLGFDRIMVCGIPMDHSGHFFDPPWTDGVGEHDDKCVKHSWRQTIDMNPIYKRSVRSMSGWTKEIFGDSWD